MSAEITYSIAMAAAQDAGNRSMREGRRTAWAVKDWNVACKTFEDLYGLPAQELSARKPTNHEQPKEHEE